MLQSIFNIFVILIILFSGRINAQTKGTGGGLKNPNPVPNIKIYNSENNKPVISTGDYIVVDQETIPLDDNPYYENLLPAEKSSKSDEDVYPKIIAEWTQIFDQKTIFSSNYYSAEQHLIELENQIQKELLTIEKLKYQDSLLKPKGPFETTIQYQNRIKLPEIKYVNLISEKTGHLYKKRSEMLDSFYFSKTFSVTPIFKLENYNADSSNWKLLLNVDSIRYMLDIFISPEEAKILWEHIDDLDISTWIKLKDSSSKFIKIKYGSLNDSLLIGIVKITLESNKERKSEVQFHGNWQRFLINNLDATLPRKNGARSGIYTVNVHFIIFKNGDVRNVVAESDPGYGLAQEAIRVINSSGKFWIAGKENGKTVRSHRTQSITWVVK
jgi:hypothetical protein